MYHIGEIIEGEVTGIQPYGVFVAIDGDEQGLIHVSEIQNGYTKNIHEVLKAGEKVRVQIVDIDEYSHKISLSLRTLEEKFQPHVYKRKRYFTNRKKKIGFSSIEKKMPKWIDESMEYLHDEETKE